MKPAAEAMTSADSSGSAIKLVEKEEIIVVWILQPVGGINIVRP